MDARFWRTLSRRNRLLGWALAWLFVLGHSSVSSANGPWRSKNFIVTEAPSGEFARQVAAQAEGYRRELAEMWLGRELPDWPEPCPIRVVAQKGLAPQGRTTFAFFGTRPANWDMEVIGPPDRVLDSVLPHEIMHTVFATHFGRPLPRWADEGACSTIEHDSEQGKLSRNLQMFLRTDRGIPFNKMFRMQNYPRDMLPLYSQGHSVTQFLLAQGSRPQFVKFISHGMRNDRWDEAIREHYGYDDLSDLQVRWVEWLKTGDLDRAMPPNRSRQTPLDTSPQFATRPHEPKSEPARQQPRTQTIVHNDLAPEASRNAQANESSITRLENVARARGDGWYSRQSSRNVIADGSEAVDIRPIGSSENGIRPEPAISKAIPAAPRDQVLLEWSASPSMVRRDVTATKLR